METTKIVREEGTGEKFFIIRTIFLGQGIAGHLA